MADEKKALQDIAADATFATHELRTMTSVLIARAQLMKQAGLSFNGDRDLYDVLGYDRQLTPAMYRDRYARGGIAGRIVEAFPNATWRGIGELVEDDNPEANTAFEAAWNELNDRLDVWAQLRKADILSAQGEYAILLIGAPGALGDELPKRTGNGQILYLAPFSQDDAAIETYEGDTANPRFGLPKTYQLKRTDVNSPNLQKPVHWSRILHIAENTLDNDIKALPRLERVWNLLDDLDKVTGGGAEAFWMRANAGMQLDVNKDMKLEAPELEKLREQAEEYAHEMRRVLRTKGVKINQLGSDVADFANPADAILTQIAGSIGIPKRILTGSEMGQLASGQDRDNWDTQVTDRRMTYAGPKVVKPLITRLIDYGYLPKPKKAWEVRWPVIDNLTETERAEGAAKWAQINKDNVAAGGDIVFSDEEIRDKWYGMEPRDKTDDELRQREDDPTEEETIDRLEAAMKSGKPVDIVIRNTVHAA